MVILLQCTAYLQVRQLCRVKCMKPETLTQRAFQAHSNLVYVSNTIERSQDSDDDFIAPALSHCLKELYHIYIASSTLDLTDLAFYYALKIFG